MPFNMLLITSDPEINSLREVPNKENQEVLPVEVPNVIVSVSFPLYSHVVMFSKLQSGCPLILPIR